MCQTGTPVRIKQPQRKTVVAGFWTLEVKEKNISGVLPPADRGDKLDAAENYDEGGGSADSGCHG